LIQFWDIKQLFAGTVSFWDKQTSPSRDETNAIDPERT